MANTSKAKAEEQEAPPAEESKSIEVVVYLGAPGTRILSTVDWASAGVQDHLDTVWDSSNNWSVPMSDLGLQDGQGESLLCVQNGLRRQFIEEPQAN